MSGSHAMLGWESVATLNSPNGDLLAYSNGYRIWNRNDDLLAGIEGLDSYQPGGSGSTISSATVFVPTTNQQFYWFITITKVVLPDDSLVSGISASLIDMTLDGGLGGIVESKKNLIIRTEVSEYLHVVRHANERDWWVYSRPEDVNDFHVFRDLLTDTGSISYPPEELMFPLRSEVGNIATSPNGCFLAVVGYGSESFIDGGIGVYQLDRGTGDLRYIDHVQSSEGVYGIAFSGNSELLYVSTQDPQRIYQIQFLSGDLQVDTLLSLDIGVLSFGQMRRGDDDLIYFPIADVGPDLVYDDYLGAIEFPDLVGSACSVNPQRVYLAPDPVTILGLPAFPNYVSRPSDCPIDSHTTSVAVAPPDAQELIFANSYGSEFYLKTPVQLLQVFDAMGRRVVSVRSPDVALDLRQLPGGYYVAIGELKDGRRLRQRIVVGSF